MTKVIAGVHMVHLKHDPYPVYLGVTFDRTLSYREYLSCSVAKLKSRNNLITKLTGTSCGASAGTLHTSDLALCYSVAEDCCPIWSEMTSVDTITQWREDWSSASVVNHTIVTNPNIRQPAFDLPRHTWSLMNRLRTCRANVRKWGLAQSPSCDCGQRRP